MNTRPAVEVSKDSADDALTINKETIEKFTLSKKIEKKFSLFQKFLGKNLVALFTKSFRK